jgi:2,3-diketo-5-methylthiopentyl-1-phosphate enolase
MGTATDLGYLPGRVQEALRGTIVNISQDSSNPLAGIVKYEFHEDTFAECDLTLLLSILLYSSIQGSTRQLRLLDLELSDEIRSALPGPRIGAKGLRLLTGCEGRPLFGVILKPRQGLTPETAGLIAEAAAKGGADYVIDDEVLVDPPSCRLIPRVKQIVRSCEKAVQQRGKPILYVVNVTSRSSRIHEWLDQLTTLVGLRPSPTRRACSRLM